MVDWSRKMAELQATRNAERRLRERLLQEAQANSVEQQLLERFRCRQLLESIRDQILPGAVVCLNREFGVVKSLTLNFSYLVCGPRSEGRIVGYDSYVSSPTGEYFVRTRQCHITILARAESGMDGTLTVYATPTESPGLKDPYVYTKKPDASQLLEDALTKVCIVAQTWALEAEKYRKEIRSLGSKVTKFY